MKYDLILYWSDGDEVFIAEVPELPGCSAHGKTQEAALKNVRQAANFWTETVRAQGREVPERGSRKVAYLVQGLQNDGERSDHP